MAKTKSSQ